ncbi:hypothetical protein CRM22_008543 [Opisthorchis felineus]|uniref:Uncharacterized protein n=1 Tax=Opisthorchis felineus TaxID=147828 RepID=A0A4S2LBB1_OPIFE|nr:hypothetical protein CRM22_008543 [Opisthorchis felineus]
MAFTPNAACHRVFHVAISPSPIRSNLFTECSPSDSEDLPLEPEEQIHTSTGQPEGAQSFTTQSEDVYLQPCSREMKSSQIPGISNSSLVDNTRDASMRSLAKRTLGIRLPGLQPASHKALFLFSEENAIRKYSKIIIEWGYPFLVSR